MSEVEEVVPAGPPGEVSDANESAENRSLIDDVEVLVIDDGSTDNTAVEARNAGALMPLSCRSAPPSRSRRTSNGPRSIDAAPGALVTSSPAWLITRVPPDA